MIRSIVFPPKQTAEVLARLVAAGDGAELRVRFDSTVGGDGIKLSIDVRSAAQLTAKDGDCEEPINASHICPGPLCP